MTVVTDVILTVAVVAVAAGAVTELQFRIGYIGASADGAAVVIIGLLGSGFFKRHRTGTGRSFAAYSGGDKGEQVQHIFSCENQVVQKTHQREQIVGEEYGKIDDIDADENYIYKTQKPSFYWQNKEDHKLGIGVGGSKQQNDAQVQVVCHIAVDKIGKNI